MATHVFGEKTTPILPQKHFVVLSWGSKYYATCAFTKCWMNRYCIFGFLVHRFYTVFFMLGTLFALDLFPQLGCFAVKPRVQFFPKEGFFKVQVSNHK